MRNKCSCLVHTRHSVKARSLPYPLLPTPPLESRVVFKTHNSNYITHSLKTYLLNAEACAGDSDGTVTGLRFLTVAVCASCPEFLRSSASEYVLILDIHAYLDSSGQSGGVLNVCYWLAFFFALSSLG